MSTKLEQTSATNANPVLNVDKNGCVLYSNEAGNSLLNEWDVNVGEKLPSPIGNIVQSVISRNSPEKMEIIAKNRIYLVVFSPLPVQECVNISGFDISSQKELEGKRRKDEAHCSVAEALEAERRRLYDVLETLPVMICLLTSDYRISFANRNFREKFGECEGRHCYEFRFKRIKPCEFCEASKVLETRKLHKWVVTIPDGSVLEVYNLPFTDVDGSPLILEMDIDITERKKAEEKLRESEEKYRNIVETSNEGIYFVNCEAKITFANKMMETSGYSLDEIIGRPVWNFIPEESMPVAKKEFEKRQKGISGSYELKLLRKNGSYIWTYITAKPFFNKKGKFTGYLAMMTDITERKEAEEKLQESEEKYRNFVETANEGIVTTDNEETVTFVNNKVIDTLGYAPEEVIGRPIWSFINEEYRPIVKMHLKKREQGMSESYELKLIHKNGSPSG